MDQGEKIKKYIFELPCPLMESTETMTLKVKTYKLKSTVEMRHRFPLCRCPSMGNVTAFGSRRRRRKRRREGKKKKEREQTGGLVLPRSHSPLDRHTSWTCCCCRCSRTHRCPSLSVRIPLIPPSSR